MPDAERPRYVVFRAGADLYGLPLAAVREVVVPRPPFARVPRAAPCVFGAMNLRGRVVAVVDLAALLRTGPAGETRVDHVVILDRARRALGIAVGPVLGVEPLALPSADPPASDEDGLVRGNAPSERYGTDVVLLDPDILEARAASRVAGV